VQVLHPTIFDAADAHRPLSVMSASAWAIYLGLLLLSVGILVGLLWLLGRVQRRLPAGLFGFIALVGIFLAAILAAVPADRTRGGPVGYDVAIGILGAIATGWNIRGALARARERQQLSDR
jgi:hypothetical protein